MRRIIEPVSFAFLATLVIWGVFTLQESWAATVVERINNGWAGLAVILAPLIIAMVGVILWSKYGKDTRETLLGRWRFPTILLAYILAVGLIVLYGVSGGLMLAIDASADTASSISHVTMYVVLLLPLLIGLVRKIANKPRH